MAVCKDCGKEHIELTKVTADEADSLMLINHRMEVASEWINTSLNPTIIESAMKLYADSQNLMKKWWDEIFRQYKIAINEEVRIDFNTRVLYYTKEPTE